VTIPFELLIIKLKRFSTQSWRGFGVHNIPGILRWIEVWGWVVQEASFSSEATFLF
jgi:hypothetical protein